MKEELSSLIKKYETLGQWEAEELLLRPADALRLADDLLAIGVLISGGDIWYHVKGGIAEDPSCLDLSVAIGTQRPIERMFGLASQAIHREQPAASYRACVFCSLRRLRAPASFCLSGVLPSRSQTQWTSLGLFLLPFGLPRCCTSVIHLGGLPRRFPRPRESRSSTRMLRKFAPVPPGDHSAVC
jgi:hypothetical protein